MKSNWKQITNVKVTAFDLDGNIKDVQEFHNLITTVGLGMVIDFLWGALGDGEIKDMAIGDDNTDPVLANTTLGNETDRWTMTTQAEASTTSLLSVVYIAPSEAVYQIEEIGWFAGAGCDGVGPDTGIMVSRVLYSRNKTAIESLQIERLDTMAEA